MPLLHAVQLQVVVTEKKKQHATDPIFAFHFQMPGCIQRVDT